MEHCVGLWWVATMARIVTSIPVLVLPVLAHPDADAACTAHCNFVDADAHLAAPVWMQMRCCSAADAGQVVGRPPTHLLLSPIGRAPVTAKREEWPALSLRRGDQGMG